LPDYAIVETPDGAVLCHRPTCPAVDLARLSQWPILNLYDCAKPISEIIGEYEAERNPTHFNTPRLHTCLEEEHMSNTDGTILCPRCEQRNWMAGARDLGIFTEASVEHIVEYAGGIPRIVNTVCDHCLLIGYADQTRRISRGIVDQAIGYLEVGARPRIRTRGRVAVRRSRARSRPSQMSSFHWGLLGVSAALVSGVAATIFLHPNVVPAAMDLSTSYLADLARSVRELITR